MDGFLEQPKDVVLEKCLEVINTLTLYMSSTLEDAVMVVERDQNHLCKIMAHTAAVRLRMIDHKHALECLVGAKRSIARRSRGSRPGSGSGAEMDAALWSKLPEELLHKIVAQLPLPSYLRFRSVCRSWESLASSEIFHANVQAQEPWFLVYDIGNPSNDDETHDGGPIASAYSFSEQKWRRMRLPQSTRNLKPLSSSGGLVCFGCINYHDEDELPDWPLVVINPITQEFRNLPQMFEQPTLGKAWPWFSSVGLTVDPQTKAYKVVVVIREPWSSTDILARMGGLVKIYDSVADVWTTCPKKKLIDYPEAKELVYCSGYRSIFDMESRALVNCYDIYGVDDVSTFLQTNVEQCLFVVEIGYLPLGIVEYLYILKLEPPDVDWEYVTYIPLELLHNFFGVDSLLEAVYTYDIHQSQNFILLMVLQSSTQDYESTRRRCTLLYDMAKQKWSLQPVLNGADGWVLNGELSGVFFQPQLNGLV